MDCKKYVKPNIILPIFIGIIAGVIFLFNRRLDDIHGLPFVFAVLSFCSIFFGVHNVNKINNKIKPNIIVPLLFGILGILGAFILLFKEEFEDSPGVFLIIGALCIGFIFIGIFNIKKIRRKIDPGIVVPLFYCISGIILTIILEFDGELTKMQRSIVILVFIFIATISIGVVMLIRKIKTLNVARHNCT
jgi:uncharacterized membrane protein YdcZ (DUF606 family)